MYGTFACTVFPPGGGNGIPGSVTVHSAQLVVECGDRRWELQYHNLSASRGGYNDSMLVLSTEVEGGKLALYFEDRSVIEVLSRVRLPPGLATQLNRFGKKRSKAVVVLMVLILVGLAGWGFYEGGAQAFRWGIGAAVEHVPPEMEVELGRMAASDILTKNRVCSAPEVNEVVQAIGDRLVGALDGNPYEFRFRVVDSPDVNAFALPGGYVFVNFGLVQKAATPDEVAGVMAHEIQHALLRHGLRNVVSRAGLTLLVALVFGDLEGIGGIIAGGAGELAALSFSREQEEAADSAGLALLYKAGFDPEGLPAFFEKLSQEEEKRAVDLPSFLSTHPDTSRRVADLRATIAEKGRGDIVPLEVNWENATADCDPVSMTDPDKKTEETP